MKCSYLVFCLVLVCSMIACVSNKSMPSGPREPVAGGSKISAVTPTKNQETLTGPDEKTSQSTPTTIETCFLVDDTYQNPPFPLKKKGIFVTRFLKTCVTLDGKKGFEKTTPFIAMGIPCTGGSGRIDWDGTYYEEPKVIDFIISTNCAMKPANSQEVHAAALEEMALDPTAKLLAYNPLVVQYWEIPSVGLADKGYAIKLLSTRDIQTLWTAFKKSAPIAITLYGRENSWAAQDNIFSADAEIIATGRTSFTLRVISVKVLQQEDVAKVMERCQSTRPRKNCAEIFQ